LLLTVALQQCRALLGIYGRALQESMTLYQPSST